MTEARQVALRDAAALLAARGLSWTVRRFGRGATSLPGLAAARLAPGIDARLAANLRGAVLVTGTNGKTSTAKLLATIVAGTGHPVVANASGANLRQSIGTVFVNATTLRGRFRKRSTIAVLEVDEAALPAVRPAVPGAVLVMTNLFRDQLDRFGETDHLVRLWTTMLSEDQAGTTIVFCADDPRVTRLAQIAGDHGARLVPYGFAGAPDRTSAAELTPEPVTCPSCGAELGRAWTTIGHLGDYLCAACGFARPQPAVTIEILERDGLTGQRLRFAWQDAAGAQTEEVGLQLPGLGNAYNAGGAVAAAIGLGLDARAAVGALAAAVPPFARFEHFTVDGRTIVLSLLKNPATMAELTSVAQGAPLDRMVVALNDAFADGRDVSWYWDCSPADLVAGRPYRLTGRRAADFAVRLKYALADDPGHDPPGYLGLVDDPTEAVDRTIAEAPRGGTVLVVATYTALLGIRAAFAARGAIPPMPR
ncbi:MAG: MurT ligase domain-containing protein [Candidatus Limnocylindrales bacterium]